MHLDKDNYVVRDENEFFRFAVKSVIGDRKEQQDSCGYELNESKSTVVVCDGMGGYENGKLMSSSAVDNFMDIFHELKGEAELFDILCKSAPELDKKIVELSEANSENRLAGTTISAAVFMQRNMYWLSVGDSRIYVKRADEFVQITRDHNFGMVEDGKIAKESFDTDCDEICKREVLISFLGAGNLPVIDCNEAPFFLKSNDRVLIMSDGLYKILSDDEIFSIVDNFSDEVDALNALDIKAAKAARRENIKRDNTTVAILTVK